MTDREEITFLSAEVTRLQCVLADVECQSDSLDAAKDHATGGRKASWARLMEVYERPDFKREADGEGVLRIAKERRRQIGEEGYDETHDDEHTDGSLALVAALYATPILLYRENRHLNGFSFVDPWPWAGRFDARPHNGNVLLDSSPMNASYAVRVRHLEKAGALCAAELDRLFRAAPPPEGSDGCPEASDG